MLGFSIIGSRNSRTGERPFREILLAGECLPTMRTRWQARQDKRCRIRPTSVSIGPAS